jgi:hypothetical protein
VEAVARPRAPGRHLDLSGASMETASKPEIRPGKDEGPVEAVLEPPEMEAQQATALRPESLQRPFGDSLRAVPVPYKMRDISFVPRVSRAPRENG